MKKDPHIVIGVLTARANDLRRDGVLSTWGKDAIDSSETDLVFLVGDPHCALPYRENHVLYLPCPDDYDNLPQKTRWFCLWALTYGGNWQYLFKCDDDTYVRIDRLLAEHWPAPIVGCQDGNGDHFHGGAGYTISREAALAIAAHLAQPNGYEDWLARDAVARCGMWFEHDARFCFNKNRQPDPSNSQITCHYASPLRMRLIHDSFRSNESRLQSFIPRIIHQTWFGQSPVPERLLANQATWKRHHPNWELRFWTDDTIPKLMNQAAFNILSIPAQKSHLVRYELLHQYGGVYVDLDVECKRPLDDLAAGSSGFVAAEDDDTAGVAVMGAAPESSLLQTAIRDLPQSLKTPGDPPTQSGSRFFTRRLLKDTVWRVFWWDTFYPSHWSGRASGNLENAYAVHHWEASWRE